MSDDFLSRWSRRKREVAKAEHEKAEQEQAKPAQPDAQAPEQPSEPAANSAEPEKAGEKADEVDLSALPSLEDITGTTDISGFLRRGVPEELTRSALRKAWSSDPAIRDFIGLSENAWDFNDPNAIPGFGPIDFSPEQVRQMAAKLVGDVREASETIERVAATAMQHDTSAPASEQNKDVKNAAQDTFDAPAPQQIENAAQQEAAEDDSVPPPRKHGGALPR